MADPSPFVRRDLKKFQLSDSDSDGGEGPKASEGSPSPQQATQMAGSPFKRTFPEGAPVMSSARTTHPRAMMIPSFSSSDSDEDENKAPAAKSPSRLLPEEVGQELEMSDSKDSPKIENVSLLKSTGKSVPIVKDEEQLLEDSHAIIEGVATTPSRALDLTSDAGDEDEEGPTRNGDLTSVPFFQQLKESPAVPTVPVAEKSAKNVSLLHSAINQKTTRPSVSPARKVGHVRAASSSGKPSGRTKPNQLFQASSTIKSKQARSISAPSDHTSSSKPQRTVSEDIKKEKSNSPSPSKKRRDVSPSRISLYEMSTAQSRRHAAWVKQQIANREKIAMKECTFAPAICENSTKIMQARVNGIVIDLPARKHLNRPPSPKDDPESEKECVFKPTICQASRDIVVHNRALAAEESIPTSIRLYGDYQRRHRVLQEVRRVAKDEYQYPVSPMSQEQLDAMVSRMTAGTSEKKRIKEHRSELEVSKLPKAPIHKYDKQEVSQIVDRLAQPPREQPEAERRALQGLRDRPAVSLVSQMVRSLAMEECLRAWHSFLFEESSETNDGQSPTQLTYTLREHVVAALLSPVDWIPNSLEDLRTTRIIVGIVAGVAAASVTAATIASLGSCPFTTFSQQLVRYEAMYGPQDFSRHRPKVSSLVLTCPPPPKAKPVMPRKDKCMSPSVRSISATSSSLRRQQPAVSPKNTKDRATDTMDATMVYDTTSHVHNKNAIDMLCEDVESLLRDVPSTHESTQAPIVPDVVLSPLSAGPFSSPSSSTRLFTSADPFSSVYVDPLHLSPGYLHPRPETVPVVDVQYDKPNKNNPQKQRTAVSKTRDKVHQFGGGKSLLLLCAQLGRKAKEEDKKRALRSLGTEYAKQSLL